jgi:hypothetical protein
MAQFVRELISRLRYIAKLCVQTDLSESTNTGGTFSGLCNFYVQRLAGNTRHIPVEQSHNTVQHCDKIVRPMNIHI